LAVAVVEAVDEVGIITLVITGLAVVVELWLEEFILPTLCPQP